MKLSATSQLPPSCSLSYMRLLSIFFQISLSLSSMTTWRLGTARGDGTSKLMAQNIQSNESVCAEVSTQSLLLHVDAPYVSTNTYMVYGEMPPGEGRKVALPPKTLGPVPPSKQRTAPPTYIATSAHQVLLARVNMMREKKKVLCLLFALQS